MLLMLGLIAGLAVGLLRGGSLYRLGELRGLWLAILSLALDMLLKRMPSIALLPKGLLTTGCYLCVLLFVLANRRSAPATAALSAGTLCNYAVKAANAFRMPVSVKALSVYTGITSAGVQASRPDYFIAENGAKLLPLGDIFYIAFPWQKAFFSIGDFLIAAGVCLLVIAVMGKRQPAETAALQPAPEENAGASADGAVPPAEEPGPERDPADETEQ